VVVVGLVGRGEVESKAVEPELREGSWPLVLVVSVDSTVELGKEGRVESVT